MDHAELVSHRGRIRRSNVGRDRNDANAPHHFMNEVITKEQQEIIRNWTAVPSDIVETRDKLLLSAKFVRKASDKVGAQRAVDLSRQLDRLVKSVEERRRGILKPVEVCIDGLNSAMRALNAPVLQEITRLRGLAGEWQRQEDNRLHQLALERQREDRKRADEAKRLSDLAIQQDSGRISATAAPVTLPTRVPDPLPMVASSLDATTVRTLDFEVTDIWALAQHDRSAVEITVRKSVVNQWIRAGSREIPGVRVFEVTKVR